MRSCLSCFASVLSAFWSWLSLYVPFWKLSVGGGFSSSSDGTDGNLPVGSGGFGSSCRGGSRGAVTLVCFFLSSASNHSFLVFCFSILRFSRSRKLKLDKLGSEMAAGTPVAGSVMTRTWPTGRAVEVKVNVGGGGGRVDLVRSTSSSKNPGRSRSCSCCTRRDSRI